MKIDNNNLTIGIISDTHSHVDERIITLINTCDYAIHAGDICGEAVLNAMQPKTGQIFVVAGNNDPYCHESGSLANEISLQLPKGKISIEHGHEHGRSKPSHSSMREKHADSRLVVYGHTHKQLVDDTALPWIINPGAAGLIRNHGGPSCLILHCDHDDWRVEMIRFENSE
ncbi:MAG TPA: metallophosphoesterase [Leucothrix mucor]|uniref:Phosphoesterase n=1 Tax=Leucothrix mucor TaxID=45248 RepID=A0A7V2T393_LEUMU|nr:metallophosphoesterase [Leucothrix mucor]